MAKYFKRFFPSDETLNQHPQLRWLGTTLLKSSIWRFNKKTISKAFAVGLFCAFLPIPFQMPLAAGIAVIFNANLPISVVLVWITNPATMVPIFFAAYQIGAALLGVSITKEMAFSQEYLTTALAQSWQPLLLGSLLFSMIFALIGFFGILLWYRIRVLIRKSRHKKDSVIQD